MAEINDVYFKMVADIANVVVPLVGTQYQASRYVDSDGVTQETIDSQTYGETRTVPPTLIHPTRPMLSSLTTRAELGKASISIEVSTHDAPCQQYTNKPEVCVSKPEPTLTFAQSDATITLGGTITPGNVIGLQCGNSGTSYLVQAGDTLNSIAANLADAAPGDGFFPVTAFGNALTVDLPTGSPPLVVTVGVTSSWIRPTQYRRRAFDALVWTANPEDRQYLGRVIETIYDMGQRLPMPDGSIATIKECQGPIDHEGETPDGVFVRRIRWIVDFIAVKTFTKTTIVATSATLNAVPFGTDLADFTAPTASQL